MDQADIVYLHDPDEHWVEAISQAYPTLAELRAQGVIGRIGVGMTSFPRARPGTLSPRWHRTVSEHQWYRGIEDDPPPAAA
jgi:Aldo/keto reductase family